MSNMSAMDADDDMVLEPVTIVVVAKAVPLTMLVLRRLPNNPIQ